ncbi:MAG TPA: hypothetical protein VF552_03180 [Allosphingosinicella sp.]|jgi:hypothetical protein
MPRRGGCAARLAALLVSIHAPAAAGTSERGAADGGDRGSQVRVMRVPGSRGACGRIVHRPRENRIEMGATFPGRGWPDLECASGGDIDALIAIVERAVFVADARTAFVPERGPAAARTEAHFYLDRLVALRSRVVAAMAMNATLCHLLTRGIDADGVLEGHPVPPSFLAAAYCGLSRRIRPGRSIEAEAACRPGSAR